MRVPQMPTGGGRALSGGARGPRWAGLGLGWMVGAGAVLSLGLAGAAQGAWTIHRHESLTVATDGGAKEAQQALATLVQAQHTLADAFGRPMEPIWPLTVVMKRGSGEFRPIRRGKVGYVMEVPYGPLAPRAVEELVGRLVAENTPPLGPTIDPALPLLFSTLAVQGPRVQIGAPVPAASRTVAWATMHLLFTDERYSGKVRALFGNLASGADAEVAWRNAFGKTEAELVAEAKGHLERGQFGQAPRNGKPINPERFYREELNATEIADLSAPAATLEGLSLEQWQAQATANPRWPEPHVQMAALESEKNRQAQRLRHAAQLAFRNVELWKQAAERFAEAELPAEATKCWAGAERAAATKELKAELRNQRRAADQARLNAEAEARRQEADKERAELERIKAESLARVREAEAKANAGGKAVTGKIESWWDGPRPDSKVSGRLERVDCLGQRLRLHVRSDKGMVLLAIPDLTKVLLQGRGVDGKTTLGCGAQAGKPELTVEYFAKKDAKLGTVGEAAFLTFAGGN